jgi:hypothetical protein
MASPEKVEGQQPKIYRRSPPLSRRIIWRILDAWDNINWLHIAFQICAYTYIAFILYITWKVLPVPGHWSSDVQSNRIPIVYQDVNK